MYCDVELFSDIVSVYPIPRGTLTKKKPSSVESICISAEDLGVDNLPEFLDKLFCFSTIEKKGNILIDEKTIVKSSSERDIFGNLFAVEVTCNVLSEKDEVKEKVQKLCKKEHDFILLCGDDSMYYIDVMENAYAGRYEETKSSSSSLVLSIELRNKNGIQRLYQD